MKTPGVEVPVRPRLAILIAHAAWLPDRKRTLARLLEQIPDAEVLSSRRREHAAQWAHRAWSRAEEIDAEHTVVLNDDVTVCPNFVRACEAMTNAAPTRIISLHTSIPEAARINASWVRCYWLTGPGYILPRGIPGKLLDYWAELPWKFASSRNEDNIAIHYMWEQQEPAWSSIPALVTHDTGTKSSLGYDNHPLRTASVPWEQSGANLDDEEYWREGVDEPPFVENPWMQSGALDRIRRVVRSTTAPPCELCWEEQGTVRHAGTVIGGRCLSRAINVVMSHTFGAQ